MQSNISKRQAGDVPLPAQSGVRTDKVAFSYDAYNFFGSISYPYEH